MDGIIRNGRSQSCADEDIAVEFRHVSKYFRLYADKGYMLKEMVLHHNRVKYEKKYVLEDISFRIRKGESLGIIGRNGGGKSTTLKLITRIIYPSSGEIVVNGCVSSLLELGAGFHPDLSGLENIRINAAIFGMDRREIREKQEQIIAFSELGDAVNRPVRTYSSGMYMRLAFSVAINVNADILLLDEILSVGDVNYQAKCMQKLDEIRKSGTTIVLVSHSPEQIEQVCARAIWLEGGCIRADGAAAEVNREYLGFMKGQGL